MKKLFIIGVIIALTGFHAAAAPEIILQADNVDSDIASYVQSELIEQLSFIDAKQVTIRLLQDGDRLTINYIVGSDYGTGQEVANDMWTELDQTLQRVVYAIKNRTYSTQTTTDAQNSLQQEKQTIAKSENQETSSTSASSVAHPQQSAQQQTQLQTRQQDEVSQRSQQQGQSSSYQATTTVTSTPSKNDGQNIFLGINGTFGMPMETIQGYFFLGLNFKAGVDFAWPLTDHFALGAYMTIGGGPSFEMGGYVAGGMDFKVGALMLFGEINRDPFIFGVAPCTGYGKTLAQGYVPFELRFGRITREHLYITGNLTFGVPLYGGFIMEPAITVGYHFGDKFKK